MWRWLIAAAVVVASGMASAEEQSSEALPDPSKLGPQGQVILNPEPDYGAPSQMRYAPEELAGLSAEAGPAPDQMDACPETGGWEVVVIRGSAPPDVVRPHMISVLPGC
jgi:hypothetical protein